MNQLPDTLRENVRLLGELLGESIQGQHGPKLFKRIEDIRRLSKSLAQEARENKADEIDYQPLVKALSRLPDQDVLPIARAFNQFLNLTNIADQQYFYGVEGGQQEGLGELLDTLADQEDKDAIHTLLSGLNIELVLTAHPTEVTRRTLIHKYEKIATALSDLKRADLLDYQRSQVGEDLARVIEEIWHTDEIRTDRPSAVEEAKWGFAVIENSLWQALPQFLRHLDQLSELHLGKPLPMRVQPFHFYSWMGGDRDGNPNVTHQVTREVLLLGRWKAADLYLQDSIALGSDLSMYAASSELIKAVGKQSQMPYRDLLHKLRERLQTTMDWAEAALHDPALATPDNIIHTRGDLLSPLLVCHRSLCETGLKSIADGPLLDMIRRVHAFGINLLPLDIRQHSDRHVQFFDELTLFLDLGSYREWDESERQDFLLAQLAGKRPLMPQHWPVSADTAELIDTCRVIATQPPEILSHYVISMANQPSDVLAVALLLKECGISWPMPIVPLFETLDDLERAPGVMNRLWQLHWYQEYIDSQQTVMIGYSDSAKDAGKFAATWAQYRCQEQLVQIAEQHDVKLNLFHGRGGTIGRGGGPVETAMASQPPGSVRGRIRVTEQGEMIRYKFGMPNVAFSSLSNYVQATLRATVNPAPAPRPQWRELMDNMAEQSLSAYRTVVQDHPDFVPYFRSLTPEQELNKLALGSRPAKRKADGGVESLRAIPWVFAWTQVRLNLPGWLGAAQALAHGLEQDPDTLQSMLRDWPFFTSFIDLLEMVLGKTDAGICAHYEQQLVDPALTPMGQSLRQDLATLIEQINSLKQQDQLLDGTVMLQLSMAVRKPYIDPLNYLQAELLKRERKSGGMARDLERALKVTMSGIAAGMRNTG